MHVGRCISLALAIIIAGSLLTFSIGLIFFTYLGVIPFPFSEIFLPSLAIAVAAFALYIVFVVVASKVCPI